MLIARKRNAAISFAVSLVHMVRNRNPMKRILFVSLLFLSSTAGNILRPADSTSLFGIGTHFGQFTRGDMTGANMTAQLDLIAAAGFTRLIQVPIGFTADHIETLYDIDITHRQYALEKGLSFQRIPSLNAGAPFIRALKEIITKVDVR